MNCHQCKTILTLNENASHLSRVKVYTCSNCPLIESVFAEDECNEMTNKTWYLSENRWSLIARNYLVNRKFPTERDSYIMLPDHSKVYYEAAPSLPAKKKEEEIEQYIKEVFIFQ
jgi:hypothetical protein